MISNARLGSGLELVHYPVSSSRFVDIALTVGVGTRFEPEALNGISHFTEHVLFRGCKGLPTSFKLNLAFDRIGDGLNALTHKEFTMFTTRVPVARLEEALALMSKFLSKPLFKDVEREKGVVLEEILEEVDHKGRETDIDNVSRKLIFGEHPIGRPILGRPQTLLKINRATLSAFHQSYYHPSNMVLAISGGVEWPRAKKAAQTSFGKDFLPRRADLLSHEPKPAPKFTDLNHFIHFVPGSHGPSQIEVLMSFFMPGERAPNELARLFLSRVLDDGISSRLQRTVCEKRGLLYDISTSIESFTDIALFDVQFSVSAAKLAEVLRLVIKELNLLKKKLVERPEFNVVCGRFTRDIYSTAESSRGMASMLAEAFLLKLPMPLNPQEYEGRVHELTPKAVRDEARAAFRLDRCATVIKGKLTESQKQSVRHTFKKLEH